MPLHQLGPIPYDMWEGPPPKLVKNQITLSVRPGVNGTAAAFAGVWTGPFDIVLTANWQLYQDALAQESLQLDMIGGVWGIIKDTVNYLTEFSHVYRVLDCETLRIRKIIRFTGPDKDLLYPTEIVTRWKLLPIAYEY
jgi:hypothetical protein